MDAVTLTIAIRGLGLLFLILGGVYALYGGFRIIQMGPTDHSRATFKVLGLTTTASGAGAVIMITAGFWAYLGVRMAPNLAMDKAGAKVYAFATQRGQVTVPELAIAFPDGSDWHATVVTPENSDSAAAAVAQMRSMFSNAVLAHQAVSESHGGATLRGKAAKIDAGAASVALKPDGEFLLSAPLRTLDLRSAFDSKANSALITFKAETRGPVIVFVPKGATAAPGGSP